MECGPYSTDLGDFHKPGASTKELETTAIDNIKKNAEAGKIDSLDNLKKAAVYLVGGTEDTTVPMLAVQAVDDVYSNFDVEKMEFLKKPIQHDAKGADPIGGIKYLYTQLGYAPSGFQPSKDDPWDFGELIKFDQKEFVPEGWTWEESTFSDFGYAYVPKSCNVKRQCNVHFVFHGCNGSPPLHLGYNEFAAANDIIMVYPDSKCWGYSGTLDDDKAFTYDGMMPTAVMKMVNRVTTPNDPDDKNLADFVASTLASFLQ